MAEYAIHQKEEQTGRNLIVNFNEGRFLNKIQQSDQELSYVYRLF